MRHESFERYEDGTYRHDAVVQREAARWLAYVGYLLLGDAPNRSTTSMTIDVRDETQKYELTVRRVPGKTPAERIGELEAELAALRT